MKIGIIGLGAMGEGLLSRLLADQFDVVVWDRNPERVDFAAAKGAIAAASISDALQGDLALSVLWDDEAIRSVLMHEEGLGAAAPGLIHVCMSTISLAFAEELADFHAARQIALVGAPMLGRPEVIPGGGLNILAAAQPDLLDRCDRALGSLGRVWRVGKTPVEGFAAKLAANFMISGAIESMAEAAAMLKGIGAEPDKFIETMGETLFACFIYRSYGAMVTGRTPPPPTPAGLGMPLKDNANFLAAAAQAQAHVPLAKVIRENLATARERGFGHEDWSIALAKVASPLS